MSTIHILHSYEDAEYVRRLAEELGVAENSFQYPGGDAADHPEKIDAADLVIVILTSSAYNSIQVQRDLAQALSRNKPILSLLLEGEWWSALPEAGRFDIRGGQLPPIEFYEYLATVATETPVEDDLVEIVPIIEHTQAKSRRAKETKRQDRQPSNNAKKELASAIRQPRLWGIGIAIILVGTAGLLLLSNRAGKSNFGEADRRSPTAKFTPTLTPSVPPSVTPTTAPQTETSTPTATPDTRISIREAAIKADWNSQFPYAIDYSVRVLVGPSIDEPHFVGRPSVGELAQALGYQSFSALMDFDAGQRQVATATMWAIQNR